MPSLSRITATFFVTLINRLGVRPPPADGFELLSTVQPVSLVDADISIPVAIGQVLYPAPVSAGVQTNPAVNTVLADTGALPAGTYHFRLLLSTYTPATNGPVDLQHRDSANAANIWAQRIFCCPSNAAPSGGVFDFSWDDTLLLNERVRAITAAASAAADVFHANIFSTAR